jgi:hypothetical protein
MILKKRASNDIKKRGILMILKKESFQ